MEPIYKKKNYSAKRISTFDKSGGNSDAIGILAGETKVIANIQGPGIISHIWLTAFGKWGPEDDRDFDSLTLRKMLIRMYWDDEIEPSVCAPLGDFFNLGHARAYTHQSAFFSSTCNAPVEGTINPRVAMNCWLPMPFGKSARIELVNEQKKPVTVYFYIDYQCHDTLPDDTFYLHSTWKRVARNTPVKAEGGKNLSDKDNYVVLEAEGEGTFVGMNMSIDNLEGGWWGEGDDMIFIDREGEREWPPDLHGTGTEDYLSHAWGMQKQSHLYCGQPWSEINDETNGHHFTGKVCVYRFHEVDPIPFTKNIRISIEHGHANDRGDDWVSTAYWYQSEPHKPFGEMMNVDDRIPRPSMVNTDKVNNGEL